MNFGWMSGVRPWVGFRSVEGRKETYIYFRKITKREKNESHRVCSGRRQVCAEANGQAPSCMRSARLGLRRIVVRRRQNPGKRWSVPGVHCIWQIYILLLVHAAHAGCAVRATTGRRTRLRGMKPWSPFSCQQKSLSLCINENRCMPWIKGERHHKLGLSVCTRTN